MRFIEPRGRPRRPFNAWISRWPILGPVTLATILSKCGHDVAVYNENISGSVLDNRKAYHDVCTADVVGISIMTPTAHRGYEIADAIRRDSPRATIVFGGVHATFMPRESLEHGDIVVRGEGETVINAVAEGRIESGVIDAEPLEDLDSIPPLDHSLIRDFDRASAGLGRHLYELPVMTSRGCPYGCTYCSVTRMFGRRVRRQSVAKVLDDVAEYCRRGFRRLMFYDDNLISDREWSARLLDGLRDFGVQFNAQVRADFHWRDNRRTRVDSRLLSLMKKAGAAVLFVGYETVDDGTARKWQKGYRGAGTLESRLFEDTRILHEKGFWIHGMFVMGPEHTPHTASRIVQFARRSAMESMQISILTPFPGTPLFEEMRPNLVFTDFPADWDFYDGTHCVYDHGAMNIENTQRAVLEAHGRFYRHALSLSRLKAILHESATLRDRFAILLRNARIARRGMREMREETRRFIDFVRHHAALSLNEGHT